MRHCTFTPGQKPRVVVELSCDLELLIAMIKDKELEPAEVTAMLSKGVEKITEAIRTGLAKRQAAAQE